MVSETITVQLIPHPFSQPTDITYDLSPMGQSNGVISLGVSLVDHIKVYLVGGGGGGWWWWWLQKILGQKCSSNLLKISYYARIDLKFSFLKSFFV